MQKINLVKDIPCKKMKTEGAKEMKLLKEKLGEELFNQVKEALGDTKIMVDDGNFIPKHRFDEVNETKKLLESQIKVKDKELKDLAKKFEGNEDLASELATMKANSKKMEDDYKKQIADMQLNHGMEAVFNENKVKDAKLIKALLDMDKIKLDGDKVIGLDDQITALKESHDYLFNIEEDATSLGGTPNFRGMAGGYGDNHEPEMSFSFSPKASE